mgnify:CR=1 FL=1
MNELAGGQRSAASIRPAMKSQAISAQSSGLGVAILIPALNEAAAIERAVSSAWDAGADEVIVADGGSTDATVELARSAGAHVITSPRGRALQQNAAAAEATADVLLFQHADNWCSADCLTQIREALSDKDILGGAFRQRIDAPGFRFRLLEWGNAMRVRLFRLPYGDQGIFMRREVFERLGRFPEVALMEDVLLMQKFRRLARPVLLPGPHFVSARRWHRHGVLRQTLRNWRILLAHTLGASPDRLVEMYVRHDAKASDTPDTPSV